MTWAGTGVLWTVAGEMPRSMGIIGEATAAEPRGIDPDRRLRAHFIVERLSGLGLGHRGRGARARLSQALRIGDGAQRSHPSGHAENRGQRHLSHCHVHRLPAAGAGHGTLAGAGERVLFRPFSAPLPPPWRWLNIRPTAKRGRRFSATSPGRITFL
jgi:hypothetical protein